MSRKTGETWGTRHVRDSHVSQNRRDMGHPAEALRHPEAKSKSTSKAADRSVRRTRAVVVRDESLPSFARPDSRGGCPLWWDVGEQDSRFGQE